MSNFNTLNLFRNESNPETYTAGEAIFHEGDAAQQMYVVTSGSVDIVYNGNVIEAIEPGGIFGELALVDDSTRSASAVAKTDCVLAPIDRRRFTFLVQETPFFALEVMGVMARRLRRQTV
jgi:CRP-like cAMP-binding protein